MAKKKLSKKQMKFKRYLIEMRDAGMLDEDEPLPTIPTNLAGFKAILLESMDGAEEDALKGVDMILSKPTLKKIFTKKEIDTYIGYAFDHFHQPKSYNPVYKTLKRHKYRYNFEDVFDNLTRLYPDYYD